MPRQDNGLMALQETYANAYNEITQPDKVFVATQYFRRKWVPLLGPALSWLIIALRQRCYWNRQTGEKRDWCLVTQEELAQEIGVSSKTVRRLLQQEHASQFIVEVKNRYRYDNQLGKLVRKHSFYRVRMDDPLIPEDEELLRQRMADELAGLSVDPETGQRDMGSELHCLKLLDRMISGGLDDEGDLPDKISARSGDEGDLPDKMSARRCPERRSESPRAPFGVEGSDDEGDSEGRMPTVVSGFLDVQQQHTSAAQPPEGSVAAVVHGCGVHSHGELENLTLTDDQVLVPVYADNDAGEACPEPAEPVPSGTHSTRQGKQELFSVQPLIEVVKRDVRTAGRYSRDISLLNRREVYYSVEHALGRGGDEWTEEERQKIQKRNELERKLGERFNRLGGFSLEEALQQYFSPELTTRFLAGQAEGELGRIEGWVTYTRQAEGLTNPGGFLRSKIESGEHPPFA